MRYKILILLGCCALAACENVDDRERDLCINATQGLPHAEIEPCRRDVANARYNAWNDTLSVYRSKSRPRAQ